MTNIANENIAGSIDELSTCIKAVGVYVQARDEHSLMAVANLSYNRAIASSSASLAKAWNRLAEIAVAANTSKAWSIENITADLAVDCPEVVAAVAANTSTPAQATSVVEIKVNPSVVEEEADPYLIQLQEYESRMLFEIEHYERSAKSARSSGRFQASMVRQKRQLQAELKKVRDEIAYVLNPTANKTGHVPFFFRFIDLLAA